MVIVEVTQYKEFAMAILVLKLPSVKRKTEERPRKCPHCQGETFQRWGRVQKPVRDPHCRTVRVYRYRCCRCGKTFRQYPEGISRADQTKRLQVLAVLCWTFGMSYRKASLILSALGMRLCALSVWRDAQEQARVIQHQNQWGKVRAVGVDGAAVLGWGEKQSVLVVVDLGNGEPIALANLDEKELPALERFLAELKQRLGVSLIVTDDLFAYRIASEHLQLGHQICQFHVRRWVGKVLRDFRETIPNEWQFVLEEIQELIDLLPPDGDRQLYALWKRITVRRTSRSGALSALEQLRDLVLRLSERWEEYCTFQHEQDIPWTNNATEQAIGRMKMRARTVRGYKTWAGMQTGLLLAGTKWF
jgi:transposase-like protein